MSKRTELEERAIREGDEAIKILYRRRSGQLDEALSDALEVEGCDRIGLTWQTMEGLSG